MLCGCSKKENNIYIDEKEENTSIEEETKEDSYEDDNPIKLGLFAYNNNYHNKSVIEDTYFASFTNGVDIGSFEVFFTDEKEIDGTSFKDTWRKYYDMYSEDISKYKIGYNIKFILSNGENFEGNFLEPDIYKFSEYFYVYLYDDYNQADGTIYSHLENVDDNTIITSIKIYAVDGIDNVENIILTAFTYDSDEDFDSNGNYRGNSHYTIRIKRK